MAQAKGKNAAMRAELDAVLASPRFRRAPVMRGLLTYLVEREASDNPEPPKAYEIAVDALGRDADFDIRSDSYPRVQIGRLRSMLRDYYAKRKIEPALQIPLGHYSIEFSPRGDDSGGDQTVSAPDNGGIAPPPNAELPASSPSVAPPNAANSAPPTRDEGALPPPADDLAALLAKSPLASANVRISLWILLILSISFYGLSDADRSIAADGALDDKAIAETSVQNGRLQQDIEMTKPPKLYLEVETLFDDPDNLQKRQLSFALRNHLENFESLAITVGAPTDNAAMERDHYKLTMVYTDLEGQNGHRIARMNLIAIDVKEVIWSEKLALPKSSGERRKALGRVAARVAGKYGIIASSQRKRIGRSRLAGYNCLLEFDAYRAVASPKKLSKIESCVAESLEQSPYNARLLAAAAFLAHRENMPTGRKEGQQRAQRFASRALSADRNSPSANFAVARSAFLANDCLRGREYADRAIKLSPDEPDYMARTGMHLLACDTALAEEYARQAITYGSSTVPYFTLVYANIGQDDPVEAMRAAKLILPGTHNVLTSHYDLTMAIANAAAARDAAAKRYWVKARGKFREDGSNNAREIVADITGNSALAKKSIALLKDSGISVQ